jgi:hypothetical protein
MIKDSKIQLQQIFPQQIIVMKKILSETFLNFIIYFIF